MVVPGRSSCVTEVIGADPDISRLYFLSRPEPRLDDSRTRLRISRQAPAFFFVVVGHLSIPHQHMQPVKCIAPSFENVAAAAYPIVLLGAACRDHSPFQILRPP